MEYDEVGNTEIENNEIKHNESGNNQIEYNKTDHCCIHTVRILYLSTYDLTITSISTSACSFDNCFG